MPPANVGMSPYGLPIVMALDFCAMPDTVPHALFHLRRASAQYWPAAVDGGLASDEPDAACRRIRRITIHRASASSGGSNRGGHCH